MLLNIIRILKPFNSPYKFERSLISPFANLRTLTVNMSDEEKPQRGRGRPAKRAAVVKAEAKAQEMKDDSVAKASKKKDAAPAKTKAKDEASASDKKSKTDAPAKKAKDEAPVEKKSKSDAPAKKGKDEGPADKKSKTDAPVEKEEDEAPVEKKSKTDAPAKKAKNEAVAEKKSKSDAPAKKAKDEAPAEKKSKTDAPAKKETDEEPVEKQSKADTANKRKAKSDDSTSTQNGSSETKLNRTDSDFHSIDYRISATTTDNKSYNFKIASWNAGGLRSLLKKNGMEYVDHEKPDILCLQEVKCSEDKLPAEAKLKGYYDYWATGPKGGKEGYAGVGLYSKVKPLFVKIGLGIDPHDEEGRVITAEYEKFYLVNAYVPNSGRGLVTLPKRLKWNADFHQYLADLDTRKPVILTGDLNVSHLEIDLARPKNNTRSAGFTQEERDGFSELLSRGFIDTFRELYPEKEGAYTYWTYMANARAKNVGWRLDYFVISQRLRPNLCDNVIRSEVFGSDHCPIVLAMHM